MNVRITKSYVKQISHIYSVLPFHVYEKELDFRNNALEK